MLSGSVYIFYRTAYPVRYDGFVLCYAADNDLPPGLVYGVIRTESGFDSDVVSHVGARGLMQITEDAYDWAKMRMGGDDTTYDDLFDPETNIRYGCYILKLLLERFGDVSTALCAYHAGAGNVENWLGQAEYSSDGKTVEKIPYKDTHWYVDKVMGTQKIYERLYTLKEDEEHV